jgi:2-oxoglutarate/2-oxoacid ferredoxin oxidoreductase subunit alpha
LVHISIDPVECQPDRYDLPVALDWQKLDQFDGEITIIADPDVRTPAWT